MTVLLVLAGGAVGAPARFLLDRAVARRLGTGFPYGVLLINVTGSLLLGLLGGLGSQLPGWAGALFGTGFCGAYTTWSTFSWDTLRLAERKLPARAALNVGATLVLGISAAFLGYAVGSSS